MECSSYRCNKGCEAEVDTKCSQEMYDCTNTTNDVCGSMPIAMAYVPWQQWGDVFTGECGLAHGTIFPDLYKPFWVHCGHKC